MAKDEEVQELSAKEAEKEKRREKKGRPKMRISGRSVIELARLISARGRSAPGPTARRAGASGGKERAKGT